MVLQGPRGSKPTLKLSRQRKQANRSRKEIFEAQRQVWLEKQKKLDLEKQEQRRAKVEQLQRVQNRKANKTFDRATLHAVQEGLTSVIESFGEAVTPLSLFIGAFTALSKSPERHQVPYLLAILSACVPRLSQGVLQHQMSDLFTLCEQLMAENVATNHLITTKAMKVVQRVLLALEHPNMDVLRRFLQLAPSKLHADATKMYLLTFRKLLEQAALSSTDASASVPVKSAQTGLYTLGESQLFFVEAVPFFVDACVNNFSDAPAAVVAATAAELMQLFNRSLSPYIIESREGRQLIDGLLSNQLLSILKPVHQLYWGLGLELLEALFNRLNYLKRVRGNLQRFTERFPATIFLLKVLNKLRVMDDSSLNGKVERAMVALGKGMSVSEFVSILPFDPRVAYEAEMRGEDAQLLWSTSYTLGVVRRIASHDSLPFFIQHYFPFIQFVSRVAREAEREERMEEFTNWHALLSQYWRIAVGFCHFPVDITDTSFRDLAKQLVGLLGNALFVDTSATAIHVLCEGYASLAKTEQLDDDLDVAAETAAEHANIDEDQREVTAVQGKRRVLRKDALDEDEAFLAMNDPEWSPHRYHCISEARAKEVCETILAKYSANIMPKLCNVYETHDSTAVLLAIQSFSKVCNPAVMTTILRGILEVGAHIAAHAQEHAEDLASGDGSAAAKTTANHAPLTSKRRMILDIACAVVAQLPAEHLNTLFSDVIEPVLMDPAPESRLLQKKAYKLLFAMFEYRIRDILPLFTRIAGLLSVGRQHITISGMKMRIRCLSWALDACKMYQPEELLPMIRHTVGEVILFSRERSSSARAMAMEVLEKMQRYMTSSGAPVNTLLHLVIGGLSGKTPQMISSAVVCMAKLVYLTHAELPEADLSAAVTVGFQLMESAMPEVRTAAAIFARMTLKLMKRSPRVGDAAGKALPKLLYAIALITSQPHVSSSVRVQMRVLLEKCIKRFGYARVDPIFPLGSKNFLRYTHKMMQREQRREEHELKRRNERRQSEFDKLFLGAAIKTGEETVEEDLMQAGALSSLVSRHAAPAFPGLGTTARDDDDDDYDNMHLDFHDGKLRILSAEEHEREAEQKRRRALADQLLRKNHGLIHADALNDVGGIGRKAKRTRAETEDFENDELFLRYGNRATEEAAGKAAAAFTGKRDPNVVGPSSSQISKLRDQKAAKRELKRRRVEEDIRTGAEFQGSGVGDVKRGNLDPYAYVPLNRRYMNRRNARQALHRFELISNKHLKGEKARAMSEKK